MNLKINHLKVKGIIIGIMNFIFLLIASLFSVNALRFNVALHQQNLPELYSRVLDISDPRSTNYGKWMDIEDVLNIISLRQDSIASEWFTSRGFECVSQGESLLCEGSIELFNSVLDMSDDAVSSLNDGRVVLLSNDELTNLGVEFIETEGRLNDIYTRKNPRKNHRKNSISVDPGYVSREVLYRLYNISDNDLTNFKTNLAAIEYQGGSGFSLSDLLQSQVMNDESPRVVNSSHIVGNDGGADTESQLDMQMISMVVNSGDLWFWDADGWLWSFANNFFNTQDIPYIISMSWGWAEDRQCQIMTCSNVTSEQYTNRVNTEYAKLAARGVTITVASGDAGAPGRTSEMCDTTRPVNQVLPGSSPWITSVSATFVVANNQNQTYHTPLCKLNKCATGMDTQPVNFNYVQWTTGGGFGIYATENVTSWQKDAVERYLNSGVKLPSNFSRGGRGYADVTAIGHNCAVYTEGILGVVDGTSCSCPTFAGIVGLLNSFQIARGKSRLGYLNPLLYTMAQNQSSTFNDITSGNNYCTEYNCCPQRTGGGSDFGYIATKGWDPVSGWGTPNVGEILNWLSSNT